MSKHPFLDINMQVQKYKIIIIHSEIICITWVIPKSAHFTVENKEIQSFKMISRHKYQKWMSWVLVPRTVCFSGWTAFIESSQYSRPTSIPKMTTKPLPTSVCSPCIWFSCPLSRGPKKETFVHVSPQERKHSILFLLLSCVVAGYGPRSCARQLLCCWAVPHTHPIRMSVSLHPCSH